MKPSVFHRITAVLLVFFTLSSSLSWGISKHFCGDHLAEISYFGHNEGCGMELKAIQVNEDCDTVSKDSCCQDVQVNIDSNQELQTQSVKASTLSSEFFVDLTLSKPSLSLNA